MKDGKANIFISIGRPLSDEQVRFKLALLAAVNARGFTARCVGRRPEDSDVPHDRPIEQIRRVIRECDGAVVAAYEKHSADKLRLNSPAPPAQEMLDAKLPTSWNQAEAAMAYLGDLPLLLISEDGLFGECLLEDGTVGSVAKIPIHESSIWDPVFQKRMDSWAKDVVTHAAQKPSPSESLDLEKITLSQILKLLGSLSWKSALVLGGGLFALLSLAYSLGRAGIALK